MGEFTETLHELKNALYEFDTDFDFRPFFVTQIVALFIGRCDIRNASPKCRSSTW